MKLLVITDAWIPQINGVVRTMQAVITHLQAQGMEVEVISPDLFPNMAMPGYREINLALFPRHRLSRLMDQARPDTVHISTEGPLGWAARAICRKRGWKFTTSYHTKFPEYAATKYKIPTRLGYAVMRRFHAASEAVMVASEGLQAELAEQGIHNTVLWSRGVDLNFFAPCVPKALDLPSPVLVYVGRVSSEKNLEAFLNLDIKGTKLVVGGGPQLQELRQKYPDVIFTGPKQGDDLVAHYASGDVFVFPSKSDTFGLVMLEAMACGLPVAAFPVRGPLDVLHDCPAGVVDENLARAIIKALDIDPQLPRAHAEKHGWAVCAEMFRNNLVPIHGQRVAPPRAMRRAS